MSPSLQNCPFSRTKQRHFEKEGFLFCLWRGSIYIEFSFMYGKKRDVNKSTWFKWYSVQYDSEVGTANC